MNFQATLEKAVESADKKNLIPSIRYNRSGFMARAKNALKRNLEEPGDCKDMPDVLVGLSIAEAEVGKGPGWIPVVQKLGCDIANLIT